MAATGACTITVTFTPSANGIRSASITITDDAADSPQSVPLSGNGITRGFAKGDVFVAVGNGLAQWRDPTGAPIATLDSSLGGLTAGMAMDPSGRLYLTDFAASNVSRFDDNGNLLGTFGGGYSGSPESIVFDNSGNAYVGAVDGDDAIRKFDSNGNPLAQFYVQVEDRGSDWIELGADQCTMYYTSEGVSVKRFNVCTNTQLPDFTTGLPGIAAYAFRLLPDGGMLVADSIEIVRLDASGNVVQTYDATGEDNWFALNLDPDGTSFWSADVSTSDVFKFDIASGSVLEQFNAGSGMTVGGLLIKGEILAATSADLSTTVTAAPNPVSQGSNTTLTVSVKNGGPSQATGVVLTNNLPSGLTFVSDSASQGSCSGTGTLTCNLDSLAAGSMATVTIVGTPTSVGAFSDSASVTANESDPNPTNNTGAATITVLQPPPTVSPSSLSFGSQSLGSTSAPQTVTLGNPAGSTLSISAITIGGTDLADFAQTNNCGNTLAVGASCTISVTFKPTASGLRSGTLSIADNASGSPQTVSLTGTGVMADFTLAVASGSSSSASVSPGGSASYSLTLTPTGGFNQAISLACTGAPSKATCTASPASVTPDGINPAQVIVNVTTTAASLGPPGPRGGPSPPEGFSMHEWWLALLLLLMLGTLALAFNERRQRVPLLAGAVLLAAIAVSCGGGGGGGGGNTSTTPGTPSGTYTLTVTGTSGSLQHSTAVTLVVN